ncbi:hypothetical protein ACX0G9_31005, partial [Flavitalea flava]
HAYCFSESKATFSFLNNIDAPDRMLTYPQNFAYAYKCFELNDGTLLMFGGLDIPEMYNGRTELAMWRLDANGNLLWEQTDSCSFWTQYSGSLDVIDLTQDAVGNIYLSGNQRAFDAISYYCQSNRFIYQEVSPSMGLF